MSGRRNRQRAQPAISNSLLAQAEAGSKEHLWELFDELKPTNCTSEVIRVTLKHLDPNRVPNIKAGQHRKPPYNDYGDCALACVTILSKIVDFCEDTVSLRAPLADAIDVDKVDGISLWVNYCLHFGLSFPMDRTPGADFRKAYFIQARFLTNLLEVHPQIRSHCFTASTFSDVFLRLWMTEGKRNEVFYDLESDRCPILSLLLKITASEEGRAMLIHRIQSRPPDFPLHFAERFLIRLDPLEFARCDFAAKNINMLLACVQEYFRASDSLRKCFEECNYLRAFSATLVSLTEQNAKSPGRVANLINPTRHVVNFALEGSGPGRRVHNVRDLVEGEMLENIIQLIAALPSRDTHTLQELDDLLHDLMKYTIYPCVLNLAMVPHRLPPGIEQIFRAKHSALDQTWSEVFSALADRKSIFHPMPGEIEVKHCDNFDCPRARTSEENSWECSGCLSAVYCSVDCQTQDWRARHRLECSHALADRLDRKESGTWYSHRSRSFHIAYLEHCYNDHVAKLSGFPSNAHPNTTADKLYPMFNYRSLELGVAFKKCIPLDEANPTRWLVSRDESHRWTFPQAYLNPRLAEMIKGYEQRQATDRESNEGVDFRFAQGYFPGEGDSLAIIIVVKLKKIGDRFRVVSSVAIQGSNERLP